MGVQASDDEREPMVVTYSHFERAIGHGTAHDHAPCAASDMSDDDRHQVLETFYAGLWALKEDGDDPGIMVAPRHQSAALVQSMFVELAHTGLLGWDRRESGAYEVTFDHNDLAWLRTGLGWLRERIGLGRFDFRPPSTTPTAIPDTCRLAILGDWGSGMYGAPACAKSISTDLIGFDAVVHLGDVYYSGSESEIRTNFLRHWPDPVRHSGAPVISRACNSNHEMYSGGHPYVDLTLDTFGQSSSAFSLANDQWLVVGLDTAYDEWDLAGDQATWLDSLLTDSAGRRVILMSHHLPFSQITPQHSNRLAGVIGPILDSHPGKVVAWYWGHEHVCAIYEPDRRWGLNGRCVGHGGFPYPRDPALAAEPGTAMVDEQRLVWVDSRIDAPAALVLDGPNSFVDRRSEIASRFGPNGYMTVELRDDELYEQVMSPDGVELWSRVIESAPSGRVGSLRV